MSEKMRELLQAVEELEAASERAAGECSLCHAAYSYNVEVAKDLVILCAKRLASEARVEA